MSVFDSSVYLAKTSCQEAVGKTIICDDGIPRHVVEIVPSHAFPWLTIINENDPDSKSGYFVHSLDLACQLLGKPRPTEDQKEAFKRVAQSLDYNETKNRHERRRVEKKMKRSKGGLFLLN